MTHNCEMILFLDKEIEKIKILVCRLREQVDDLIKHEFHDVRLCFIFSPPHRGIKFSTVCLTWFFQEEKSIITTLKYLKWHLFLLPH